MIYVGIDDTDVKDSPGTNQLARRVIQRLRPDYESVMAVRHQLLFDRRIPYTSKNSSASLLFRPTAGGNVNELADRTRQIMRQWLISGSDPGLCVTKEVPMEVIDFGRRCQREVVRQKDAQQLAARCGILLEGLGGTKDGVIGALAAVGLVAGGNDGRVVSLGAWPDDLSGPQEIALLQQRGVSEIRCVDSHETISAGLVDVGKHLRPNYRDRRIVLFAKSLPPEAAGRAAWQAVRFT